MTEVYVLQHVREFDEGREDVKMIGVYSTMAEAQAAIERLRDQPGFRDLPNGFSIDAYELGKDHWAEGYVTEIPGTKDYLH